MSKLLDKIIEAKGIMGDKAAEIIAEGYPLEEWDERRMVAKSIFNKHDNTPSMAWNKKDLYFKDFSTGKTFGIIDYYMYKYNENYIKAVKRLLDETKVSYSPSLFAYSDDSKTDFFKNYLYPKEETQKICGKAKEYELARGISETTMEYADLRCDSNGNIAFQLKDCNGRILAVKYRPGHKLKPGEPKMFWQKNASNCPSLYNMDKCDITKPLLICEGFNDALACIEAGYTNVVSIPGGAEDDNWIQFNYDWLECFDEIILWFDNDNAGQQGLNKVVARLGEYRCKIAKPTEDHEDAVEAYYQTYGAEGIRKTDANNVLLASGANAVLSIINSAEYPPAKNLKFLMDCSPVNISDIEKCSTGLGALDGVLYGNLFPCFTIYSGYAGCVDCDTEFFDGAKWKRIADFEVGDKVLQYNKDGTTTLVTPQVYHKYEADKLWHFESKYGINQCLSDEHNVYYITSKGNLTHHTFEEIRKMHEKSKNGFTGKFITSFNYSGSGIDLTDAEIKLMCAVICDGNFYYDNKLEDYSHRPSNDTCRFHIKKERKKTRLRELFNECNLEYRETSSATDGYTEFYVKAPRHEKEFTEYWYNCTQRQLQIICDNILFWDGHEDGVRKSFSTNVKTNADFVQFAFSSCGYRARVLTNDRSGQKYLTCGKWYTRKSIEYIVSITKKNLISLFSGHSKTPIKEYKTLDGYKYCFTVPSSMWVMRRNGCIVVSGNCGKSSLANVATVISAIETGHKVFVFSGELSEGQLLDWIMSPLCGPNHIKEIKSKDYQRAFYYPTQQAEERVKKFYHDNIILYSSSDELDTSGEGIMNAMTMAYKRYGCDVFLIDNLMCISFENTGEDSKWDSQKKFIIKLMNFTNQYNVCTNLVLHPKKPSPGQNTVASVYDLHGASEIGNLCHRLIWVSRGASTGNDIIGKVKIDVVKDRPSQAAGSQCEIFYDKRTRRLFSNEEELYKEYSWEKTGSLIQYRPEDASKLLCNLAKVQIPYTEEEPY